ncbi:hypothetical protein VTH8203_03845 [Vibrio thalassae]|uniref:Uncharacterized protein n=1 Tax=Vibrio thalassae TaxID=1243014 RepID=A0A240ENC0_9VIBR|nr:hypothetical protein [Vibrio thalassae]SNX50192.1 hypothetical protein VTH8203_03845 [Vibrio thalassae]
MYRPQAPQILVTRFKTYFAALLLALLSFALPDGRDYKRVAGLAVTKAEIQQLAKQIDLKDMITVAVLPKEKE